MRIRARRRTSVVLAALTVSAAVVGGSVATTTSARAAGTSPTIPSSVQLTSSDDTGLAPGSIKHVWLIILENKSYDATFSGLNKNSYLWQTLPQQGVLLKNYYGTGHSSQDNYEALVSGQAAEEDTQEDCDKAYDDFGANDTIIKTGGLGMTSNYGQVLSKAGANAPDGQNGCVYPSDTPTLFNQLDAAGKTWKGYAQDLEGAMDPGETPTTEREGALCGGPGTPANNPTTNPTQTSNPTAYPGVTSFTGAQANDQYVAKHFPFPWFHSLLDGTSTATTGDASTAGGATTVPVGGGTDCDAAHIANLDSPTEGLYHDLQSEATTPDFSWITPDNCSDAHDAVCKGNNLSGAFDSNGNPLASVGSDPENSTPINYTGGLYASDLFLKWYIPMIEQSPAFKDGGLIDVTFDEGNPPFTYSGNSFYNADNYGPTATDKPGAVAGIKADQAGENIDGKNVASQPEGPNSTLSTNSAGQQLTPGDGNNAFIDRPPACTSVSPPEPAGCVPGIVRGGSGSTPGARNDTVTGTDGSIVTDSSITELDTGRAVTDTTDPGFPSNVYVGQVTDVGKTATSPTDTAVAGSFQLVDGNGTPVTLTSPVTKITLAAETLTQDPLYDATDATPGGGETGSVLISPYIRPGSVSSVDYNHYSWLRTMEDLFDVSAGTDTAKLAPGVGSVSGGLDGLGHIGYAAQKGLTVFGNDVFTNPAGSTPSPALPEAPLAIGLPLVALAAGGTALTVRRRRRKRVAAA